MPMNKSRLLGGTMMVGGGGAMSAQFADGGLPHNQEDWIMFAIKAVVTLLGLLLNGKR